MKALKFFTLLIGLFLFNVSFGNTIYLEYDQSCMDRYEYKYKGVEFGASHIAYHLRQNNNEKVVLEVGIESKINYEVKPKNVRSCRDVSLNERMVRDVNNGDIQLFIVKRSGRGYNVSPVGIATYAQITPQGFGFVTLDNMYSYRYNQPANGTNLARKDSEAKMFFNGTLSHNCPRKYLFTKTKSKAGKNYSEYTIIPEIGVIEEKTGFNQTDAANNVLELVAINGLPIESYLSDYCQGKDLNYVYSGTFYSNRSGKASSKPSRGSSIADLERGKNSQPVDKTTTTSTETTTTTTPTISASSFNCPVYKDVDRGLYIDRNTGNPANLSCGGNDYRNGKMVNTPLKSGSDADNNASNVANVTPGPATDGSDYCLEKSSDGIHVVQPSETLYTIAQYYNLTLEEIRELNRLADDKIFPCMKVYTKSKVTANASDDLVARDVPEFLIHVVAPGETIYQIAQKYGYTVDKFKEVNGLESNMINVGQKLKISNCNCPTPETAPEPAAFTAVENDLPDSFENASEGRLIVDNNQKRKIHIVRENETIYTIAKEYDLSAAKLRELNNLEVNEVIIPYQRLYVN